MASWGIGAPRAVGGVGAVRGCRGLRSVLGACRDCRYSWTRRSLGASWDIGGS